MKNYKKNGFTMVELLVVLALVSLLMLLIFTSFNKQKAVSRDNVRIADIDKIRLALDQYRNTCREYPEDLDLAANNGCPSGISLGTYLTSIPKNPQYGDPVSSANESYRYASLTTDVGGACLEYHLGVELEFAAEKHFVNDHDFGALDSDDIFDTACSTENDFNGDNDTTNKMYDFRSTRRSGF